ncbi:MAG: hypothetical protein ACREC0_06705 [Methylocella sp.]
MSRLEELWSELQGAAEAVAHAERTLAANPTIPSVAATLRTIQKRHENLEEQFSAAAHAQGLDVCGYRIELDDRPATIAGMSAVLAAFQRVFTSVYDALDRGPKLTSKSSAQTVEATAFGFAYTYPGSVGVMMTLANNPQLIGETKLDEAMQKTLELIHSTDPDKVQSFTESLGVPAVRLAYQWAAANIEAGFGADITWRREAIVKAGVRLQPPEIAQLAATIKRSIAKEEVNVVGELIHVDTEHKTFRMSLIDALGSNVKEKDINGTFDRAITSAHPAQLPKVYRFTLNILQKVVVEDAQEEISYFLLRLDTPAGPPLLSALESR